MRFPLLALCALSPVFGFCQLRVATWNITNWSSTEAASRNQGFQNSLYGVFQGRSLSPDILAIQEVETQTGMNNLVALANNAPGSPGDWAAAPFVNGLDTESVFLYRTSKVDYVGMATISTGGNSPQPPRNTYRYDFRPKAYTDGASLVSLYNVHFKAASSTDDVNRRLVEAQRIRDNAEALALVNPNQHFIIGGDFNMPGSNETGFQELVGSQSNNSGRFFDPINSPGSWRNSSFRFLHTQDPWDPINPTTTPGGMDDRFDLFLLSGGLVDGEGLSYLGNPSLAFSTSTWNDPNHSYRVWGNDGSSYNQPLTIANNTMVGPTIAQALMDSLGDQSGHLPVFLDLRVSPRAAASPAFIDFGYVLQNSNVTRPVTVTNVGNTALWTTNGIAPLRYIFALTSGSGFSTAAGPFFEQAAPGSATHLIRIDTSMPGRVTGTLTITHNDGMTPPFTVTCTGVVMRRIGRR